MIWNFKYLGHEMNLVSPLNATFMSGTLWFHLFIKSSKLKNKQTYWWLDGFSSATLTVLYD